MVNAIAHCLPPSPTLQTSLDTVSFVFPALKPVVVKLTLSNSVVQVSSLYAA